MPEPAKDRAKSLAWERFEADRPRTIAEIVGLTRFTADDVAKFTKVLEVAATAYSRRRAEATLWRTCEGKQVLNAVAHAIGFADQQALSQATFALWSREGAMVPEELELLRLYLRGL
jgi:hypothetical protein